MARARRCHQCGGDLRYMPRGVVNGYTYCSGCTLSNSRRVESQRDQQAQQVFTYKDAAYVPGVGYITPPEPAAPTTVNKHISKFGELPPQGRGSLRPDCIQQGENTMTSKQPTAGSLSELDGARNYFAGNQAGGVSKPKFKVGDRVEFGEGSRLGTVSAVRTQYWYTIETGVGSVDRLESYLEDAPLTPEEAWDKVAVMLTKAVMTEVALFGSPLPERVAKALRHDAYVVLGGAHIKIVEQPVKTRVRSLIQQAQQ